METSAIRNKLHEYIDTADESKLQAIYTILEDSMEDNYTFNEDEIAILHERRNNHLSGISKSYTVEKSLQMIRENKLK